MKKYPPNRSTDLALIWEFGADKVVGDPTKTRNRHEDGLYHGFHFSISPLIRQNMVASNHDELTSSFRYHGAWLRKLRNSEYMGTVRNAGHERISDSDASGLCYLREEKGAGGLAHPRVVKVSF